MKDLKWENANLIWERWEIRVDLAKSSFTCPSPPSRNVWASDFLMLLYVLNAFKLHYTLWDRIKYMKHFIFALQREIEICGNYFWEFDFLSCFVCRIQMFCSLYQRGLIYMRVIRLDSFHVRIHTNSHLIICSFLWTLQIKRTYISCDFCDVLLLWTNPLLIICLSCVCVPTSNNNACLDSHGTI